MPFKIKAINNAKPRSSKSKIVSIPLPAYQGHFFTDIASDLHLRKYLQNKSKAEENGKSYTWEEYASDFVVDMINKKISYYKRNGFDSQAEQFLKEVLNTVALTEEEKFKYIYSNLNKIGINK